MLSSKGGVIPRLTDTHPCRVHFAKVMLTSLAADDLEPCTMDFSPMATDGTQILEESFQPLTSSV